MPSLKHIFFTGSLFLFQVSMHSECNARPLKVSISPHGLEKKPRQLLNHFFARICLSYQVVKINMSGSVELLMI